MGKRRMDIIKKAVISWLDSNAHNPEFRFVVGNRAFTVAEIRENVEKETPEGAEIMDMVAETAAHLFLRPRGG